MANRIAKETITHKVDGINTVIAEAGQPIPIAFEHLVPDNKSEPLTPGVTDRSTSARRAAAQNANPGDGGDLGDLGDLGELGVTELKAEADRRGLHVEGTGKDGKVVKADLIAALETSDNA